MERHEWSVEVLTEMPPRDPKIMGDNWRQGREIRIRLRKPHNPDVLCEHKQMLDTMLHE